MQDVQEKHSSAMEFARRAEIKQRAGDIAKFKSLSRKAFVQEQAAANMVAHLRDLEPTRSILHRSAAALALDCDEFRAAEQLAAAGLGGDPPEEIADELRDILEQANFQRHLQVKGVTLSPAEVQLSIAGGRVGHGYAATKDVLPRVETAQLILLRTQDRMSKRTFDDKRPTGAVNAINDTYLSIPRAASFAVSIQLTEPAQLDFTVSTPKAVIEEVMTCCELYNAGNIDQLKSRMPEPYLNNFVGLARRLEPDGTNVTFVGFTAKDKDGYRTVSFTKRVPIVLTPPTESKPAEKSAELEDGDVVSVRGILKAADSRGVRKSVIHVLESGTELDRAFTVPKGMMTDIVRPLYEEEVIAEGTVKGKSVILNTITLAH